MVYRHAYLNTLLLLHSTFMLSMVKISLIGEVGGHALNSHGNYIVGHGKSWKNHGIVFLNFCGNPVSIYSPLFYAFAHRSYLFTHSSYAFTHGTLLCIYSHVFTLNILTLFCIYAKKPV